MSVIDWKKLSAPFPESSLEWRVQSSGLKKDGSPWALIIPYLDARAIMDRLDEVAGPENWYDSYEHLPTGVMCELTIGNVTKEDGSQVTDIEAFKGGISKAFVRAAVKFGMGRNLYDTPTTYAKFVEKNTEGAKYAKIDGRPFYWIPPKSDTKPKEVTQNPEEIEEVPKFSSDNLFCELCGDEIIFYATKGVYACKNKEFVKDNHTSLKPNDIPAFRERMLKIHKETPNSGTKTAEDEKKDGTLFKCSLCGTGLILGKDRKNYFCPNYRQKSKGFHTTIRNEAIFTVTQDELKGIVDGQNS